MTCLRCIGPLMLSLFVLPAWAQPRKTVEVWGSAAIAHAAGDESFIGTPAAYGGGVAIPLTRSLAINFDVERMRAERFNPVTRVFVSPALVWRWGNERVYGFAGGGMGLQIDRSIGFLYSAVPGQQQPSATQVQSTDSGPALHGQVGVVYNPVSRLILRAGFVSHWHYVLPTSGIRFGVGYRF